MRALRTVGDIAEEDVTVPGAGGGDHRCARRDVDVDEVGDLVIDSLELEPTWDR